MDIEYFSAYCLQKKKVQEEFPYGPETLVFKVTCKIFALASLEKSPFQVSLKCDPKWAQQLREEWDGLIVGAYHMNKKHWNNLYPESMNPKLIKELIDHSFFLVVQGLTKKQQQEIKN